MDLLFFCLCLRKAIINSNACKLYEKSGYEQRGIVKFRKGEFWCLEKKLEMNEQQKVFNKLNELKICLWSRQEKTIPPQFMHESIPYGNTKNAEGVIFMATKRKTTKKQMASLGLKKTPNGDYSYIDPNDKTGSYKPVRNKSDK